MRPATYRSIFALALVTFVAVGIELVRSAAHQEPDAEVSVDVPEIVGALSATRMLEGRQMLPLSDEERAQIFDHVMRTPDVPVADVEPPDSATVPASVALQDLPAGAAQDVPLAEGHKFVKLDDRILLVHPGSRKVVAEMPRYKLVLQ
jgi:hypothetical protein